MTARKKITKVLLEEEDDLDDLMSHLCEDVYVRQAYPNARSVRVIAHPDSEHLELLGCNQDALDKVEQRLTESYVLKSSKLRRPPAAELKELMDQAVKEDKIKRIVAPAAKRRLAAANNAKGK
jgi:hypothetical protein